MRNSATIKAAGAVAAAAAFASTSAHGDVLVDFAYNSLSGDYDAGTQVFTARAVAQDEINTSGNVRRIVDPAGTAEFDAGFAGLGNSADLEVTMDISGIVGSNADGAGSFTVTDVDGDTITGSIAGTWVLGVDALFFNGFLTNVRFNDNGASDNEFNGSNGSGFSMDLSEFGEQFSGAAVLLHLGSSEFFDEDFQNAVTDFTGQIIPQPGALALLGMGVGFGFAGRRRRA